VLAGTRGQMQLWNQTANARDSLDREREREGRESKARERRKREQIEKVALKRKFVSIFVVSVRERGSNLNEHKVNHKGIVGQKCEGDRKEEKVN
jgi:uncharacterized protein Veg